MSDRGANLLKALRDYETLFCFLHRINNVLKRSFFQLSSQREKSDRSRTHPSATSSLNNDQNDNDLSPSATEGEEAYIPTIQIRRRKKKNMEESSTTHDPMQLKLNDFSMEGQAIIKTIEQCKSLVRYVKKVSTCAGSLPRFVFAGANDLCLVSCLEWPQQTNSIRRRDCFATSDGRSLAVTDCLAGKHHDIFQDSETNTG